MDQLLNLLAELPIEPLWVMAGLLALLHASIYGFIFGPSLLRYPLFIAVSAVGVYAGQMIGEFARLNIGLIGDLKVVTATLGAWLLLVIAKRLGA